MVDLGPFVITVFGLLFMQGPTNSLLVLAGAQVGFVRAWRLAPTQAIAYGAREVFVTTMVNPKGLVIATAFIAVAPAVADISPPLPSPLRWRQP
jgi:hypothetical protein